MGDRHRTPFFLAGAPVVVLAAALALAEPKDAYAQGGKLGETCHAWAPCADGLSCDKDFTCYHSPRRLGQPCGDPLTSDVCASGLSCHTNLRCYHSPRQSGEPCVSDDVFPCAPGLRCDDFTCRTLIDGARIAFQADDGNWMARCQGCQSTIPSVSSTAMVHLPRRGVRPPDPGEHPYAWFTVTNHDDGTVSLQSDTGLYLGRCHRCVPDSSEDDSLAVHVQDPTARYARFNLESLDGGEYALRADTGLYVGRCAGCSPSAQYLQQVAVHAASPLPYARWRIATAPPFPNGTRVALQADNGFWMGRCLDCQDTIPSVASTAMLHISSGGTDPPDPNVYPIAWFTVTNHDDGTVSLQSDTGLYLGRCHRCVPDGTEDDFLAVHVQDPSAPWARFNLENLGGGEYALRADSGLYVGRCGGCSPSARYTEQVAVHLPSPLPYARWRVATPSPITVASAWTRDGRVSFTSANSTDCRQRFSPCVTAGSFDHGSASVGLLVDEELTGPVTLSAWGKSEGDVWEGSQSFSLTAEVRSAENPSVSVLSELPPFAPRSEDGGRWIQRTVSLPSHPPIREIWVRAQANGGTSTAWLDNLEISYGPAYNRRTTSIPLPTVAPSPPQPPGCVGSGCWLFDPCCEGTSCQPGLQKCYHSPRRLGEPCSLGFGCGPGLSCQPGVHKCYPSPRGLGDPCSAGFECGPGLSCQPGVHKCYPSPRGPGDPCSAGFECGPGLSCQPGVHQCYHSPRWPGEPCSAGFECMAGYHCQSFAHRCVSGQFNASDDNECNALYSPDLAAAARDDGITLSFGAGAAATAVAAASHEVGVVYGGGGEYGCYEQTCTGMAASASIGAFFASAQFSEFGNFAGESTVTFVSISPPVLDFVGLTFAAVSTPALGPIGTAESFSVGKGDSFNAVDFGVLSCTTTVNLRQP